MAHYLTLREFISDCGGFTEASKIMLVSPQTLFNATKANRSIMVKLNDHKKYIQAYEIKPFPIRKLSKM